MKQIQKSQFSMQHSEKGASLIVTLMILILVSLIGVTAVKRSNSDLSISTGTQVNNVLFQSSDMSMHKLEVEAQTQDITKPDNVIGFLDKMSNGNDEITFCIRPRESRLFNPTKISRKLKDSNGVLTGFNNGYCDPDTAADFNSSRQAAMTQMTVTKEIPPVGGSTNRPAFGEEDNLTNYEGSGNSNGGLKGSSSNGVSGTSGGTEIKVTSTSVLPAFSSKDNDEVAQCLRKGSKKSEIDACLAETGTPYSSQEQNYVVREIERTRL